MPKQRNKKDPSSKAKEKSSAIKNKTKIKLEKKEVCLFLKPVIYSCMALKWDHTSVFFNNFCNSIGN